MTPAAIEWRQRMIALWSARAGELRASSAAGAQQRALGLEWIVVGLQREIDAAAPAPIEPASAPAEPTNDEALRRQLAAIQPRFDRSLGVAVNNGPIMEAVRAQLQARLDGAPFSTPPIASAVPRIQAPAPTIPAEVIPFMVGPQLGLFGDAL